MGKKKVWCDVTDPTNIKQTSMSLIIVYWISHNLFIRFYELPAVLLSMAVCMLLDINRDIPLMTYQAAAFMVIVGINCYLYRMIIIGRMR